MLEQLKLAKYRFVLQIHDPLHLPSYKGGILRGAFGTAFKRIACRAGSACVPTKGSEHLCQRPDSCAYGYVFETPVPPDAEVLRTHQSISPPFVIEPPVDDRQHYQPGDTLTFNVVLIGAGIQYLPYFVLAFKTLGAEGFGPKRSRFQLDQIWALDALGPWQTLIYDGASDTLRNEQMVTDMAAIKRATQALSANTIRVHFQTPTRLKHAGEYVRQPDFHVLVRALLRRISTLYYFHCGQLWDIDYAALVTQAQTVRMIQANTNWVAWQRFSSRQRRQIKLDGFVGEITYEGHLAPFHELLVIGSLLHVGKACVFGWGAYSLINSFAN